MHIDRIQIQNFKGFADETFNLNPRFTVFIGDNAKGKTSVLDALAVAAGCFLRGIDVAKHETKSICKNDIRIDTVEGQPRPQLPVVIKAFGKVNGKSIDGGWYRNVDAITKKITTKFIGAKNIEEEASVMLFASRNMTPPLGIIFPVIVYHSTGRLWAEHEGTKKGNKSNPTYKKQGEGVAMAYNKCLSPKSSSKEFLSWYKTYEDEIRKFNQEKDKLFLEVFNECIISMIPDDHWQNMAYSFADNDLAGYFTTSDDTKKKLLFSQLSDGYRNVISMVADIAYRCIKLNPHLGRDAIKKTPGIVLIDELDLHLHPNWQRRIVSDLKNAFPEIQFVATTHSPFIVQSLASDEVWNLDKQMDLSPNELKIDTIATEVMGVPSSYSTDNEQTYKQSKQFLTDLEESKSDDELKKDLDEITNPAIRAFLELQKMSKGK